MKPAYIILAGVVVIGAGYLLVRHWKKQWHQINEPIGKQLGYPDCCVKAFCDQPPQLLKITGCTRQDKMRYDAACVNGKFTGFIPCQAHAKKIIDGEITLESLITNRSKQLPDFPDWGKGGKML